MKISSAQTASAVAIGLALLFSATAATAADSDQPDSAPTPPTASDDPQQIRSLAAFEMTVEAGQGSVESTFTVGPGTYKDAAGKVLVLKDGATWTCVGVTDDPHYSKGAEGVIAKTRLACGGPAGTIPIEVQSLLGRTTKNSISSLKIVKESNYVQYVVSNGSYKTWYVPETGKKGSTRGAYFRASNVGRSAPPLKTFSTTPGASNFKYVK
jgi:hypothetical protein